MEVFIGGFCGELLMSRGYEHLELNARAVHSKKKNTMTKSK